MDDMTFDEGVCRVRVPRQKSLDGVFESVHGGILMTIGIEDLLRDSKNNLFGTALRWIISNGEYLNAYGVDQNELGAELSALPDHGHVLELAKRVLIPARSFYEVEKGFAPYFLVGYKRDSERDFQYVRISTPTSTPEVMRWWSVIYKNYRKVIF